VAEKIPLIAASVAITIVAYYAQAQAGTVQSFQNFPLTVRAGNAIESYGMYLLNTLAPVNLALNYPHPGRAVFGQPALYVSLLVLIGFTTAAVWTFKSRPWFAVGWFWFAGLLVPVIGVVVLAEQSRADRYTYFPQIGLFVALAWGLDELRRRFPASRLLTAAAAVWIVALGVAAFVQTARWRDDYTWFTYNVDRVPSSAQAHYGLGVAYLKRDDIEMAEKCFLDAIELRPPVYEAYSNLGAIELRRGNFVKSGDYFAQALSLAPEKPDLIVNFGVSLYNLGQFGRALDVAEDALRIDPGHPRAIELRDACRTALQGGQALR
jgi:tetratricopeptide (TPR) repeat protein